MLQASDSCTYRMLNNCLFPPLCNRYISFIFDVTEVIIHFVNIGSCVCCLDGLSYGKFDIDCGENGR